MSKKDCIFGKLLQELVRRAMHEMIDVMWNGSEEKLMETFEMAIGKSIDELNPTLLNTMQISGLAGMVLVAKYGKDEKELMKILKNSDAPFVKEIKND